MKRLHFQKANNLDAFHDELLAALPNLRPVPNPSTERAELEAVIRVEGLGDDIWLTVPDDADEAAIAAVVQAHDPNQIQQDPRRQRLGRIAEISAIPRSTWTSAQMRELINLMAQELSS